VQALDDAPPNLMETKSMTSSLDVAGLAPAVAAAVQAAAVVVQLYWDRRQRTAGTTHKPAARGTERDGRSADPAIVHVHVVRQGAGDVAVSVRIGGGTGDMALQPAKEHGPW
jgi:hypothetical protein